MTSDPTSDTLQRPEPPDLATLREILENLVAGTRSGRLEWTVDEANRDSFCSRVGDAYVAVRSLDADGRQPFALVLADAESAMPDLISAGAMTRSLSDLMEQVYQHAQAAASMRHPLIDRVAEALALMLGEATAEP